MNATKLREQSSRVSWNEWRASICLGIIPIYHSPSHQILSAHSISLFKGPRRVSRDNLRSQALSAGPWLSVPLSVYQIRKSLTSTNCFISVSEPSIKLDGVRSTASVCLAPDSWVVYICLFLLLVRSCLALYLSMETIIADYLQSPYLQEILKVTDTTTIRDRFNQTPYQHTGNKDIKLKDRYYCQAAHSWRGARWEVSGEIFRGERQNSFLCSWLVVTPSRVTLVPLE